MRCCTAKSDQTLSNGRPVRARAIEENRVLGKPDPRAHTLRWNQQPPNHSGSFVLTPPPDPRHLHVHTHTHRHAHTSEGARTLDANPTLLITQIGGRTILQSRKIPPDFAHTLFSGIRSRRLGIIPDHSYRLTPDSRLLFIHTFEYQRYLSQGLADLMIEENFP